MTFASIHETQSQLARAGGRQLGSLLWWSLNGNRIEHDPLIALAAHHGFDSKYLPAEIKHAQAFRRAWRHASTRLPKGLLLRPIDETADEIVIGLVSERPNARTRDLDYDVVSRIAFNKHTAAVNHDAEHAIVWQILELYRHHQAHTTEDIRHMLAAFLAEAGVSLRESGGVYFIPASHQPTLDALCGVVEAVGKGNRTYQLPIVDTPATKTTLREVAVRTLDDEIRQLHDELARYESDKVRQSTLERRLDGFEELRSRVNLFAGVLAFKADAMNAKISAIQAALRAQMDGRPLVSSEPAARPTEPMAAFAAGVGF